MQKVFFVPLGESDGYEPRASQHQEEHQDGEAAKVLRPKNAATSIEILIVIFMEVKRISAKHISPSFQKTQNNSYNLREGIAPQYSLFCTLFQFMRSMMQRPEG